MTFNYHYLIPHLTASFPCFIGFFLPLGGAFFAFFLLFFFVRQHRVLESIFLNKLISLVQTSLGICLIFWPLFDKYAKSSWFFSWPAWVAYWYNAIYLANFHPLSFMFRLTFFISLAILSFFVKKFVFSFIGYTMIFYISIQLFLFSHFKPRTMSLLIKEFSEKSYINSSNEKNIILLTYKNTYA